MIPSTLRKISPEIFKGCNSLKIVRAASGCEVEVEKFVGGSVKVLRYEQQHKSHTVVHYRDCLSSARRILGLLFLGIMLVYLGKYLSA